MECHANYLGGFNLRPGLSVYREVNSTHGIFTWGGRMETINETKKGQDQLTTPVVRQLEQNELPIIMELEQASWPVDVQASAIQLRERMNTFGKGCLGAFIGNRLVGMATCQIINFTSDIKPISWSELCADGWISKTHTPTGNCLHFVSVCVHPDARGKKIGTLLNQGRLNLGRRLGLKLVLTDTRLPGLASFLVKNRGATADTYVGQVLSGQVFEPVVAMYQQLGFKALGIIVQCMESDVESADHGLAMINSLDQ